MKKFLTLSSFLLVSVLLFQSHANAYEVQEYKKASLRPDDHIYGDKNAPVTVITYCSFGGPFCKRHHSTMYELIDDSRGKVNWVYRHFPLDPIHPEARAASEVSECVASNKGNDAFWKYLDKMYERGATAENIFNIAEELGVNRTWLFECFDEGAYKSTVEEEKRRGESEGIRGTPGNIVVNNRTGVTMKVSGAQQLSAFENAVESVLDGVGDEKPEPYPLPLPKPTPSPAPALNPYPEAMQKVSIQRDDHIFGNPNAPISIITYCSLQGPFCQRHHNEMYTLIEENNGKVNWVYRHYPLGFHAESMPASQMAECIAESNGNTAFWKFLDRVYENGTGKDKIWTYAEELGVEEYGLRNCMHQERYRESIGAEMQQGTAEGVRGTPGNIVLNVRNGKAKLVSGARPRASFQEVIDDLLKTSKKSYGRKSKEEVAAKQQNRICRRVEKYAKYPAMFKRIQLRLEKRLGFRCS